MKRKNICIVLALVLLLSAVFCACDKTNGDTSPIYQYNLSNADANETAKRIYDYIGNLTGVGALSAQQESTWMGSENYETDYIFQTTGKYPAMRGFDYINDDFDGVNERAIKWWQDGGLVTICWHTGPDFAGGYEDSQKKELADFTASVTEGTEEYAALLAGMDKGAAALKQLQDAGVPVLWRPFHEFSGWWFWWALGGSENFVKLWRIMYDRYTDYWQLNNLIWVLGYSFMPFDNLSDWYPGDEYCDVIGADSYYGIDRDLYDLIAEVTDADKPLCFHECGENPTEEELKEVPWTWFMTWHTTYLTDDNTPTALTALYNSDYVVTRDELPSFK